MALDKQINLYSVDTGNFYTKRERLLHNKNAKVRAERKIIADKIKKQRVALSTAGYSEIDINHICNGKIDDIDILCGTDDIIGDTMRLCRIKQFKNAAANNTKAKLLSLLKNKVTAKESQKTKVVDLRVLDESTVGDRNVISLFESTLTRMMGVGTDELTDNIIVVQVYYFDIFKDISYYGFIYKGEKYRYYTSSAGQIRKKKAVFIKEAVWDKYEKTIMCGLTIDTINANGGINVNKYLAYMALTNSATDEWSNFDIDRAIVIDDFETKVWGTFDFLDDTDYSIKRMSDYADIPHTDGAGMMLPIVMDKNTMIRLPWIKGLLGVFDFRKFVLDNDYSPLIKDIYGQEHDIIAEDIRIIFTKSQFKMSKYYSDWQEYKDCFKKYNCKAGLCNTECDRIPNAKINYQMLQTLTDVTDDEIDTISAKSIDRLASICSSVENMQKVFGVTPYNQNMTPLQEAVKIYPDIMNDIYFKNVIKSVKDSLLKKYRSGKLEVNGKYTFILPDLYAACEYWFGHIANPKGLLDDKEVYCKLFKNHDKLDCLRSPHLYKEHAIRFNMANKSYGKNRTAKADEWFITNAVYTSCHDLISRILQFDVDGDSSLVVADNDFIHIAERNMNGVVPLYYEAKKAHATELNNKTIYEGLNASFAGGNIGIYSNNISKIWNSTEFLNGDEKTKQQAVDCVKLLCMENNYCIDSAKTMYMPDRAEWFNIIVKGFTNKKLPSFFRYAKDKTTEQVELPNKSIVNKLEKVIPNIRINTRKIGLGKIDYRLLMYNVNIDIDDKLIEKYNELNAIYHFKVSMKDEYQNNLRHLACIIRDELAAFGYDEIDITDMLVKTLYKEPNRPHKELLWFCYGKYIVDNLKRNVEIKKLKYVQCSDCGEWFEVEMKNNRTVRCKQCEEFYKRNWKREYQKNIMKNRRISKC